VSLFRAKTVQQRPLLPREVETWLPDCGVTSITSCYVMGRFGHEDGPFWMLAGAVLVMFFLPLGPFWFQWAVFDLHWGRFGNGPFWPVPVNYYHF